MGYGVVRAGMLVTILEKIHSYCRLTLPTLRLDLIFLLQTVSEKIDLPRVSINCEDRQYKP